MSTNVVDFKKTAERPYFIKSELYLAPHEAPPTMLVCSNCGKVYPLNSDKALLDFHIDACSPNFNGALLHWSVDIDYGAEKGQNRRYLLRCNDHLVFATDNLEELPDLEILNTYQVKPFDAVTGEYLYDHCFSEILEESLSEAHADLNSLFHSIVNLHNTIARGGVHIDPIYFTALRSMVKTMEESAIKIATTSGFNPDEWE